MSSMHLTGMVSCLARFLLMKMKEIGLRGRVPSTPPPKFSNGNRLFWRKIDGVRAIHILAEVTSFFNVMLSTDKFSLSLWLVCFCRYPLAVCFVSVCMYPLMSAIAHVFNTMSVKVGSRHSLPSLSKTRKIRHHQLMLFSVPEWSFFIITAHKRSLGQSNLPLGAEGEGDLSLV